MREIVNWLGMKLFTRRLQRIENFMRYPLETQERVFQYLVGAARDTVFGKKYEFSPTMSLALFQKRVPLVTYEEFYPYIERSLRGEANLLWHTPQIGFAKSSGTTNSRSKYIPITKESLENAHYEAGKDMLAIYTNNYPESKLFTGKGLAVGGSLQPNPITGEKNCGDVSALIMKNLPIWAEYMRTPTLEIALMEQWEEKIEVMARAVAQENVTSIQGVPTWTIFLIKKVLEITGKKSILEVWQNLECFFHGAVAFEPYRSFFQELIPSPQMNYMEVYNASEGFFALQDQTNSSDLLLLLDSGVFYEFIPMEEWDKAEPRTLTLDEVELDKNYAVVISTNGGLWRYKIGDTVRFTNLFPFRIRITGRTKHFINAFGEEIVVENADEALAEACRQTGARLKEYTAAPVYFQHLEEATQTQKGGHQWLVEFEKEPDNLDKFVYHLDQHLRKINSDYDAKRTADLALVLPKVQVLPAQTFFNWLKSKGKVGGQNKVPRLSNTREYVESILALVEGGEKK
ncbi:GH3 auxin-responsive promoter family protein [Hugenholtzia roseola]|uniref:GH3 auxin-responsive promoter family protein n=1 Tax=Hugenholtzia roseola TaxID=1002 RepID=UPI00068705D6|nr:GH3 auxin-responsive promoter family protein [Hugenholtzia roseola]